MAVVAVVNFLLPNIWEIDAIILPSKFLVQTEQYEFVELVVTDPKKVAGEINQESYDGLIAAELNLDIKNSLSQRQKTSVILSLSELP